MSKAINILLFLFSMSTIWAWLISVPTGFVVATFVYSEGHSYFSDDPKACANCHVMQDYLDHYAGSSHHHVANCNDCHTPEGFTAKYISKAINGWNHGVAFTTGNYKWPLVMTDYNLNITQKSCLKCHGSLINHYNENEETNCLHCHSGMGHTK